MYSVLFKLFATCITVYLLLTHTSRIDKSWSPIDFPTVYDGASRITTNKNSQLKVTTLARYPRHNGYHRGKWTDRLEFKSSTKPFALYLVLMPLGKAQPPLFSLQLRVRV